MSRQWKTPNHSLPGWSGYSPYLASVTPKRPKKNRSKKRAFWKSKAKLKRSSSTTQNQPFKSRSTPTIYKTLLISRSDITSSSLWRRQHGSWRCIQAYPPCDWFIRVNHPSVIQSWLRKNHYEYQWLTASKPSPGHAPLVKSNSASPSTIHPERNLDDQTQAVPGLEQNGVTTSSLLNSPGRPGYPVSS